MHKNKKDKKSNKFSWRFSIIIALESLTIIILLMVIFIPVIFQKNENGFEIERKWLIEKDKIPYDLSKAEAFEIAQTYISFSPEIRVRDINNGSYYVLTVKTDDPAFKGLKRTEQEYYIDKEDYDKIIPKREGQTIRKTRYSIPDSGNLVEIDIFHEQLEGLAYMEIEFLSTESAASFEEPNWVVKDVTTDESYKNGHLARYGIPNTFKQYINERSKNE